jgi:hypothetical protein
MVNPISQKIERWSAMEHSDIDFNEIHALIEFLSAQRYSEYGPTLGNSPEFRERLAAWLSDNVPENDQKLMFRLVPHIFFLGRAEMAALQRSAFRNAILRWIYQEAGLALNDPDLNGALQREIGRTWFCPITDSANITEFYHQNELNGEYRPDWRSFARLHAGDPALLVQHTATYGYRRIVLVEDVVGSGSQMRDVRPLLAAMPATLPIMIAPMIVCPAGAQEGERICNALPHVSFSPTLLLPQNSFVAPIPRPNEIPFFAEIRDLLPRTYPEVDNNVPADPHVIPYGPFGFNYTGALIVLYANTPDNTIPLIHHRSDSWAPLFPRRRRVQ